MFTCLEALQRIRIVCSRGLRRNIGMPGIVGPVESIGYADVVQAAPHCRPRSARRPARSRLCRWFRTRIAHVRRVGRKDLVDRVVATGVIPAIEPGVISSLSDRQVRIVVKHRLERPGVMSNVHDLHLPPPPVIDLSYRHPNIVTSFGILSFLFSVESQSEDITKSIKTSSSAPTYDDTFFHHVVDDPDSSRRYGHS